MLWVLCVCRDCPLWPFPPSPLFTEEEKRSPQQRVRATPMNPDRYRMNAESRGAAGAYAARKETQQGCAPPRPRPRAPAPSPGRAAGAQRKSISDSQRRRLGNAENRSSTSQCWSEARRCGVSHRHLSTAAPGGLAACSCPCRPTARPQFVEF